MPECDLLVLCETTPEMRARLAAGFSAAYAQDLSSLEGWLTENAAGVRYVLTDGHLGVPGPIMARLPNLRAISGNGVGYDGIDVPAALARGIPVSHTPNVLDEEVATTGLLLYLACWRDFEAQAAHARSGKWASAGNLPLARTAEGRCVGIFGLGRIGKALARKLAPFGVEILYHGRNPQDVPYEFVADLEEMATRCEALISIAPGGAATKHLVNRQVLEAIGPEGVFVNIGRGSVVDEDALVHSLLNGALGWAGLDVFEDEPNIPAALRALPNVILTPHIGSATVETRRAMGDLAIDNLLAHKAGKGLITPIPECRDLS